MITNVLLPTTIYLSRRRNQTDELVDVELEAIWSTNLKQFDFDTDMSSTAISRAFAREPWSREYFQMLQE